MMRTFRLVAEPVRGSHVAIDIVLRGDREDVDVITPMIHRFLDLDFYGSWVDEGTERETVTFAVAPTTRPNHQLGVVESALQETGILGSRGRRFSAFGPPDCRGDAP